MPVSTRTLWRIAIASMAVEAAGAAYHFLVRPRMLTWGIDPVAAREPLPGDDLVPEPVVNTTHAITIDAPPSAVWPWIVQVGYGRGGWYSHDRVERLLLGGRVGGRSVDRIDPGMQELHVGDLVPYGPGLAFPVTALEPERYLVIGTSVAFVLQPLPPRGPRRW